MEYLYEFGLDNTDIQILCESIDDNTYSDLTLFKKLVIANIDYLKDFGITNYKQIIVKYPQIFLRDTDSFRNVLSKFDKQDLIEKVTSNPAVIKKMVDYVDNN